MSLFLNLLYYLECFHFYIHISATLLGEIPIVLLACPHFTIGQAINQFKVLHVSEQDYDHAHARNVQPRL